MPGPVFVACSARVPPSVRGPQGLGHLPPQGGKGVSSRIFLKLVHSLPPGVEPLEATLEIGDEIVEILQARMDAKDRTLRPRHRRPEALRMGR
jgi:hypothetical protein